MKTIKSQITTVVLSFVVGLSVIFGVVSCALNYRSVTMTLNDVLEETAKSAAKHVSSEIKVAKSIAYETGSIARMSSDTVSNVQKRLIIDQRSSKHGFLGGGIIDLSGKGMFDGVDYSAEKSFEEALQGKASMSNLKIDKEKGENYFLFIAPLWSGGIPDTTVVGAVYYKVSDRFLNEVVTTVEAGETGRAYIINKNGLNVADINAELVGVENSIEQAKSDPSLNDIAELEKKMIAGETGSGGFVYDNVKMIVSYAPILESDGFSLGVLVPEKEFLDEFYGTIFITVVLSVVFGVFGIFAAIRFGNKIGKPIKTCTDRLQLLVEGDLHSEVPVVKTKDETAILADATAKLTQEYSRVVEEISNAITNMAKGNFAVSQLPEYKGDFLPLSKATNTIVESLSADISQIRVSAEQVSSGSEQVSGGAQELSQGATEQASTIEELSATIHSVNQNIRQNAELAEKANGVVAGAKDRLVESNEEMKNVLDAMTQIGDASRKISAIIKTIDDIAFQTNILALNAAVEAARAGEAGKGFAVVADEVRNLASKCAEAAQNTTSLIETAVGAIDNGKSLVDATAGNLIQVMTEAEESARYVSQIAQASANQALAIAQVNEGIDQISAVVQTNSATAEESAAASEELSGQAEMLKNLMARFRLNDGFSALDSNDVPQSDYGFSNEDEWSASKY